MDIDIISDGSYPADQLSNFYPHAFVFRGVACASMEGLLQSLKFNDVAMQKQVCQLTGKAAKEKGLEKSDWQDHQTLWWQGKKIDRHGADYQSFLDESFSALYNQNAQARKALADSSPAPLVHSIGENDPHKTVLTEKEFCDRLMSIRQKL